MRTHRALAATAAAVALAVITGACSSRPGSRADGASAPSAVAGGASRVVPVELTGGRDTDAVDHGRPVALVASMLGVSAPVFRDAFSRVSPAPAGSEPDPAQVGRNKAALLATLAPYGVTNDRLDEVSNHYRYNGTAGETWPFTPAAAHAVVRDGVVTDIVIDRAGSGYTSAPEATIPALPGVQLTATVAFTQAFDTNGHISSIGLATASSS
jgi:hypothetical protein